MNGRVYSPEVWEKFMSKVGPRLARIEANYLKQINNGLFGSIVCTMGDDGKASIRVVPGRTAPTLKRYGVTLT